MSKFVFEPHNLHGETIDGEAMPFGYISQIQESGYRLPVFELNTVFGDMPGLDLAGIARGMAEAPAMVEALRWALSMAEEAILVRENGDDPEDTPDICEMHRAELERHRAILSRIDGAGEAPDQHETGCASCGAPEGESHAGTCETRGFAMGTAARRGDTLPDAPALTATCPHCGRDNTGHEGEPCADDCPQYWEGKGKAHPEHPTGELVTVRADHLAALVEAAGKYADDLATGLEDGTYDDRADLDTVEAAIAAVQGEN